MKFNIINQPPTQEDINAEKAVIRQRNKAAMGDIRKLESIVVTGKVVAITLALAYTIYFWHSEALPLLPASLATLIMAALILGSTLTTMEKLSRESRSAFLIATLVSTSASAFIGAWVLNIESGVALGAGVVFSVGVITKRAGDRRLAKLEQRLAELTYEQESMEELSKEQHKKLLVFMGDEDVQLYASRVAQQRRSFTLGEFEAVMALAQEKKIEMLAKEKDKEAEAAYRKVYGM
jgi:hypothetical protein